MNTRPEFNCTDTNDYADVRYKIGQFIFDELVALGEEKVTNLRLVYDRTGPMGGVSGQVSGFFKYDGNFYGFAINIYSDDKVEKPLLDMLAANKHREAITDFIVGEARELPNSD